MFRNWMQRLFTPYVLPRGKKAPQRNRDRRARPWVELLEDRTVPSVVTDVFPPTGGVNFSSSGDGAGKAGGRTFTFNFTSPTPNPYAVNFANAPTEFWGPSSANMGLSGNGFLSNFSAANILSVSATQAIWQISNVSLDTNGDNTPDTTVTGRLTLTISGTTSALTTSLPAGISTNIGVVLPVTGSFTANFVFTANSTPMDTFYDTNSTGSGGAVKNFQGNFWREQDPVLSANNLTAGLAGNGNPDTFDISTSGGDLFVSVNGNQVYRFPTAKVNSLTINGSSDQDTVNINGPLNLAGAFTLNGFNQANDKVNVNADLAVGSFVSDAANVAVNVTTANATQINDGLKLVAPGGSTTLTGIPAVVKTLPAVNEDVTSAAGATVASVLGASFADPNAGALAGMAIVSSEGQGSWQFSTNGGATWTNFGALSYNQARLLAGTHRIRFIPAANFNGQAGLWFNAWDQTSGTPGGTQNITELGGNTAFSDEAGLVTVQVNAVNDAPVLTATPPFFTSMLPNSALTIQVANFLVGAVTDPDAGALQGIAMVAAAGNGALEISTNGGSSFTTVAAPLSASQALLLRSQDFIRFTPAANTVGTASFSFRAWDQTTGTAGNRASVIVNGGTTAFSAAIRKATVAINTAPNLTAHAPALPAINEDVTNPTGAPVSSLLGTFLTDADPGALRGIAVIAAAGAGTWQFSVNGGVTWAPLGAVSGTSARLLAEANRIRFVPTPNAVGVATIQFRGWDRTSGAVGGLADASTGGGSKAFSTATDLANLIVNAINDAPVQPTTPITINNVLPNTTAGPFAVSTLLGGVTDVDAGAVQGIAVIAATGPGNWQYSTNGGSSYLNFTPVTAATARLLRPTDLIKFVPNTNAVGKATITFRAWDQTAGTFGGTVNLAVAGAVGGTKAFSSAVRSASLVVNTAPTLTAHSPVAIGDTIASPTGVAVNALLGTFVTDPDPGALRGIAIVNAAGPGIWQYSLNGGKSWVAVGAVAGNSARLLRSTDRIRFLPTPNTAGSATLNFHIWDQTVGTAGTTGNASANGGATAFSTAQDVITINAINNAPVQPTTPITLANTLPNVIAGPISVNSLLGGATDVDAGALKGIAVIGATGPGNWRYSTNGGGTFTNFSPVTAATARLLRSTDLIQFVPATNAVGKATITFRAWDQTAGTVGGTANLASASSVGDVTAFSKAVRSASLVVNTAPTLTAHAPTLPAINEDVANSAGVPVSTLLGTFVTDPNPGALAGIAIVNAAGAGTWQFSLNGGVSWTALGAVAANNARLLRSTDKVRFVPAPNANGNATFTFRAWDRTVGTAGGTLDATATGGATPFSGTTDVATITVNPVNDAPVLPATPIVLANLPPNTTSQNFQTVAFLLGKTDVDAGALDGIAVIGATGPGNWQYSIDGGTTWLNLSPVTAATARLLRGTDLIKFVPDTNAVGKATLTFRAWDQTTGTIGGTANLSAVSAVGGTKAFSSVVRTASLVVNTSPNLV